MTDYTATPLISEEAEPLIKLIGNEYELGWRSVWIHTPDEAVRIEYRNSRLVLSVVRKNKETGSEQNEEPMIVSCLLYTSPSPRDS